MEPALNGAILVDQIAILTERHGRGLIDRAIAALPVRDREEMQALTSVSWIPCRIVTAFKLTLAAELHTPPLDFQREIVRAGTERTVNGVFRIFLRHVWDSALIKRAGVLYRRTFNIGSIAASFDGKTGTFVVHGWPTMPEFDRVALGVGIETVLEVSGRKGARVTWSSESGEIIFSASWSHEGYVTEAEELGVSEA